MPGYAGHDAGQILVQQRLAEIEQPQRVYLVDIDVAEATIEVFDLNALDLGQQRRVGAANTAQLATVDDVEMQIEDALGGHANVVNLAWDTIPVSGAPVGPTAGAVVPHDRNSA